MTQTQAPGPYDGNALAGPLAEVFAVEVTTAIARCRGCGRSSPVATLVVFGPDPGLVGRCPGCSDVLLRVVRTPDEVWLDLAGTSALRFTVPD
jgi:Family of unknown function (DUF6510)